MSSIVLSSNVFSVFSPPAPGLSKIPLGHVWTIATHTEDLSPSEINRRAEVFFQK